MTWTVEAILNGKERTRWLGMDMHTGEKEDEHDAAPLSSSYKNKHGK